MSELILESKSRTLKGRKCEALRLKGKVPAVVYGAGIEPMNIEVERNAFVKTYNEAGESSLVELKIDGKDALHVLIQDFQQDPVTDNIIHADLRIVDMSQPIEVYVEFEFINEAPAVKALGGTLMHSLEGVEIRCLPNKLLRNIIVDLSSLVTFEDMIRVEDLTIPEGVEILEDSSASIVTVSPPRSEAEMAALDEAIQENVSGVVAAVEKKEPEAEAPEAAK